MVKEKEARRPFNLKKEVKLLPGYIILLLWVIFTIALLGLRFWAGYSGRVFPQQQKSSREKP